MNSLLNNFSWGAFGNISSTLIRAMTLALLARLSAPAEFAVYASMFGLLAVGKAISDLGLTKFVMRNRALAVSNQVNTGNHLYPHALKLNGHSSLLLGMVGFVSILSTWAMGIAAAAQLLPMAASTSFEKNADTWRSIHVADGKTSIRALDLLTRRTVCLLLFVSFALTGALPPIASLTMAETIAAFASLVAVRRHFRAKINLPSRLNVRPVLASARPFWINTLAMSSRNLDVAVVSVIAPLTQSGYFAAAARLVGPLQTLPYSLATVALPHVARTGASRGSRAVRLPFYATIASVPVCILLSALASPLVPFVLGDAYSAGILCIQIIILGTPLTVYFNLTISILQGQGYAKEVSRASVVFAGLLLPAVAVGAYLGGATGAAVGTVSANAAFASLVYLVRRKAVS